MSKSSTEENVKKTKRFEVFYPKKEEKSGHFSSGGATLIKKKIKRKKPKELNRKRNNENFPKNPFFNQKSVSTVICIRVKTNQKKTFLRNIHPDSERMW